MLDKHTNYFGLPLASIRTTTSATAGILHRKVQGRRAATARSSRLGAVGQQRRHGGDRSRPNRSMQRGDAVVVLGIRVGASANQGRDCCCLGVRTAPPGTRRVIGGVVERLGATAITSPRFRAEGEKSLDQFMVMTGGSHVESRIAGVQVVTNRWKEDRSFARRPIGNCVRRELGVAGEQPPRGCIVAAGDRAKQGPGIVLRSRLSHVALSLGKRPGARGTGRFGPRPHSSTLVPRPSLICMESLMKGRGPVVAVR